jgi:Bacterial regulatory proteins, luxR family
LAALIARLVTIPGAGQRTADVIVAQGGGDMTRFRRLARRSARGNQNKAAVAVTPPCCTSPGRFMPYDGDLSERDIGQQLYVSHNTIHSHVLSICRKLGVSLRARALQRTASSSSCSRGARPPAHASLSPGR